MLLLLLEKAQEMLMLFLEWDSTAFVLVNFCPLDRTEQYYLFFDCENSTLKAAEVY